MKKLLKRSFLFTIVVSFGLITHSCKCKKQVVNDSSTNISGTWILKSLNGQEATDMFKGEIPTLNIDLAQKTISGNGGCNTFTGKVIYQKDKLQASNLASTRMMCIDSPEPEFMDLLNTESNVTVINGVLTFSKNGETVAELVKGMNSELLSGQWVLESLYGQNAAELFGEEVPTIQFFTAEHKLGGMGGCNRYSANYNIEGSSMAVGPIMSTRMACPNSPHEVKFIQALGDTSTINVERNTITLSKEGKVVVKFVKK